MLADIVSGREAGGKRRGARGGGQEAGGKRQEARGGRRASYTSACGNRTLVPYTAPLRAVLTTDRTSRYRGSTTMRSSAA